MLRLHESPIERPWDGALTGTAATERLIGAAQNGAERNSGHILRWPVKTFIINIRPRSM
jgi:hypothetical protein